MEPHPLEFELGTDQAVQIQTGDNDVAAGGREIARFLRKSEFIPHPKEIFPLEECDLAFEVGLEVKVAVAGDPAAGDAFNYLDFLDGMVPCWPAVVAPIIVTGRNTEMVDGRRHDWYSDPYLVSLYRCGHCLLQMGDN